MDTIFVSGGLIGGALAELQTKFEVVTGAGVGSPELAACAARIRGLVTLITDRVDGALLDRCPALRVVSSVSVGLDHLDVAECLRRGIVVTNTPDVLTEATADLAFGLLLDAARRITEGDRLVRAGGWKEWSPTFHLGTRVHGMKLGIAGLGRIGRAVARRARGFGMHVGYTQRTRIPENLERALGATFVPDLDELCATSDALTVHLPLTKETRGIFSAARLARMKPGLVFVNTSRGPIVDEAALAHALEHGPIAAAGLDVYEDEPRIHPALLARPNAVLAPHIGSAERETREAMAHLAAANVISVLGGLPALTPVETV